MPWPEKTYTEILARLETLDLKLNELREGNPRAGGDKPRITKKQLMEIDGVGSATADKILALLEGK